MVKFTIISTLQEGEDTRGNTQAKTPSPAAVRVFFLENLSTYFRTLL